MIYLASPYSHADENIRRERFDAACKVAAHLMEAGHVVFSPIAHSHPIEQHMGEIHDTAWWMRQDLAFMEGCERMVILALPGWEMSKGVRMEREWFEERGRSVEFMEPL